VDAVILKYLPVERPEELMQLQYRRRIGTVSRATFTNPVWEQVRDHQDVFAEMFAWSNKDKLDLTQGGTMHPANGVVGQRQIFQHPGLHAAVDA